MKVKTNRAHHPANWMRDDQCSTVYHHHRTARFLCRRCCQHWSKCPRITSCDVPLSSCLWSASCGSSITCDGAAALSLCRSRRSIFWNVKECFFWSPDQGKRQLTDLEGSSVCSFPPIITGGFQDSDWRGIFFPHGYICWADPPWDPAWCEKSRLCISLR